MKAISIDKITPAENIEISELPIPKVKFGWVLVKVKAFGMNHSEQILRLNEINADYIQKPVIPGIECVGVIEDASDTTLTKGDKVIAMMGGIVCQTGILGGVYALDGFDPIKDIPNGVYLTGFFSNYPTQEVVDDMFKFFNDKKLVPIYGKVYEFDNIKDAITAQDKGAVNGKIVVKIDSCKNAK